MGALELPSSLLQAAQQTHQQCSGASGPFQGQAGLLQPADVSPNISLCLWTNWVSNQASSDNFLFWADEDNLKGLICGMFHNPERIQDSQSSAVASRNPQWLKVQDSLLLVNTLTDKLCCNLHPQELGLSGHHS